MKSSDHLTVAEVSRRSGISPSALRFYEAEGLISATRTLGNQRRYERIVLRRLAFIRAARVIGLSLDEIREELGRLPSTRNPTKADWSRISRGWSRRIAERIDALETLRDTLDGCIGCGCLSLQKCKTLNPDDAQADEVPDGAARWPDHLRPAERS